MKLDILTKEDLAAFHEEILQEVLQLFNQGPKQKAWLKSADVKVLLDISDGTLQHLRSAGILPCTKIGGTYFYKAADVERVLEQNKQNPLKD